MRGARALKIDLRTTCKPKTRTSDIMVWYNLQHKHPWKFVKFLGEVFSYNVHAAYILLERSQHVNRQGGASTATLR